MQVLRNVTHAIGDHKGSVTFEQLMTALEGTEDDADDAKTSHEKIQQGEAIDTLGPPTIQPSAAEALKQAKKNGGSSSLTSSSGSVPPKANMWRASRKGGSHAVEKEAEQAILHDAGDASHASNSSLSLAQYSRNIKAAGAGVVPSSASATGYNNQRCAPSESHSPVNILNALHQARRTSISVLW